MSLQIFSRYTALIPSYIWTEEMARFFFIWMIMLGAMIGIRDSSHFDIDLWPNAEPPRRCAAAGLSHTRVSCALALVFVWYGIRFVQFGWNQNSELAELPMAYIFIAWPLSGVTWLLFLGRAGPRQSARARPRSAAVMMGGAVLTPASPRSSCSVCSSA